MFLDRKILRLVVHRPHRRIHVYRRYTYPGNDLDEL